MNSRQLKKLGIPDTCIPEAITAVQQAVAANVRGGQLKQTLKDVVDSPDQFTDNEIFAALAKSLVEEQNFQLPEPIDYQTWGTDIDQSAHDQMEKACHVPMAAAAALMPDAHLGYGLPIGGVLALEGAVIPYAVGVDIACRMKLSVLDMDPTAMDRQFDRYRDSLEHGTRFGVGCKHERPQDHAVMDQDWSISRITREKKDTAWRQLGTSGSGNHFVEFGLLELEERDDELDLDAGRYVALLSHSGSRGTGAAVCSTYSAIARAQLPKRFEHLDRLAWLDLDSQEGQEYWEAMNLMGDYASANHAVLHRLVTKRLGARVISGVENHHNFAWKEMHNGKELIVHRKGATPAAEGELGVIPGSMADPAFIVRGKGCQASLNSASHGAGRRMSRKQAKQMFRWNAVRNDLEKKGVRVLSAGADEVPGVYKDILEVMKQQADLVETVARFDPKIVKMCDDGSRPED